MKTLYFKTKREFYNSKEYKQGFNGTDNQELVSDDDSGNVKCWNCSNCDNCDSCKDCNNCTRCTEYSKCNNCNDYNEREDDK